MSKSVLISIQPKWCELIVNGKKTVEVRKSHPKLETPFKVYIYCTKAVQGVSHLYDTFGINGKPVECGGKVIGEFVCNEIEELKRNTIFNAPALYSQSCMTRNEYFGYIGKKTAYIWQITNLVIYGQPRELSEFYTICAEYERDIPRCKNCEYDYRECNESVGIYTECTCDGLKPITRPPQSWCYVEEDTENA
ncbi:MAG: ASCH domain-containing protein [Oscillospiraceae bacterium]